MTDSKKNRFESSRLSDHVSTIRRGHGQIKNRTMGKHIDSEVALLEIRPRIWRQFQLASVNSLETLHDAIQDAFPRITTARHAAMSEHSSSACSKTRFVAASCLSGGYLPCISSWLERNKRREPELTFILSTPKRPARLLGDARRYSARRLTVHLACLGAGHFACDDYRQDDGGGEPADGPAAS